MGRTKDEFLWDQVDGTAARWVCKHCHEEFGGSARRIRNHLSGAGNDISGCAVVPSHILDEALKKNTRKKRPSSSVRISSSSTAAAPPLLHDPPPISSNDPDPITESAPEDSVRGTFIKMLMTVGVSDAINHPIVTEFWKRARQHGVPLSLLGNDPFIIEKPLLNIKHEVYQHMLMVKESWKTTGCTLITYNISEKKENFASGGKGMDVIGFYCPKGFIFVKAPPITEDVESVEDALKQHQPSLEFDDLICFINHLVPPGEIMKDSLKHHLAWFNVGRGVPFCETSACASIDIFRVHSKIESARCCGCLQVEIQDACMKECGQSKWANSLIDQAVRLHKLLLEGDEKNELIVWYYTILAKEGEKMQMFVGEGKQFQEVHLSALLLIIRLQYYMQRLNQQKYCLRRDKSPEILKIVGDGKFWIEGRKLALVLTLMLRIPDIMDTLVPTCGLLRYGIT